MNFRDFVRAAEVHLQNTGWLMHGHNGTWQKYKRAGERETKPLPAAVLAELQTNSIFQPVIEDYLIDSGWRRSIGGVMLGGPIFMKDGKYKRIAIAMLEQMRDDRIDRRVYSPYSTPSEVRSLLSAETVRAVHDSPPSSRR